MIAIASEVDWYSLSPHALCFLIVLRAYKLGAFIAPPKTVLSLVALTSLVLCSSSCVLLKPISVEQSVLSHLLYVAVLGVVFAVTRRLVDFGNATACQPA